MIEKGKIIKVPRSFTDEFSKEETVVITNSENKATTDSLIERVTKALMNLAREKTDACFHKYCVCEDGWQAFECKTGLKFDEIARAAIEAMREPTEAMVDKGAGVHPRMAEEDAWNGEDEVLEIWQRMIDAALIDGQPK